MGLPTDVEARRGYWFGLQRMSDQAGQFGGTLEIGSRPAAVSAAVPDQRLALSRPVRSVRELLDTFLSLGLPATVAAPETMQDLL